MTERAPMTQLDLILSSAGRPPGQAWIEIIQRPTETAFATAFSHDARLEASVLHQPIIGPYAIRQFFQATRAMYDSLAFTHEFQDGERTYLEWAGKYQRRPVSGITILTRNTQGLICSIDLHHRPFEQVIAFSEDLCRRLAIT